MNTVRRKVDYGETGFRSTEGYSGHNHNPFYMLASSSTTERSGEAWGFNLVWTGSFEAAIEKASNGYVRALLGLNSLHTSIKVAPGESFQAPEAVAVYSSNGLGGVSRSYHDLYRNHLSRHQATMETRPILLNSWEGLSFDINDTALVDLAGQSADIGIELFVMDDGWFGLEYPRNNDSLGLGDWTPNPEKFPDGLGPYIADVTKIDVMNASTNASTGSQIKFGLWMEVRSTSSV
jgi:alpha-galactosidase